MTTKTDAILEQVKSEGVDEPTLTQRVDNLEDGQVDMKAAISENTLLTQSVVRNTEDLVLTTNFFKTLAKAIVYGGAVGAGLYGLYQGYEFFHKLWATGL